MVDISGIAQRNLDDLKEEVTRLQTWFRTEYPEANLRCLIDYNNIRRELHILIRVLTGKEMTNDQCFFETPIRITEKQFFRDSFMRQFLGKFNEELRKSISVAINNHFHNERAKDG